MKKGALTSTPVDGAEEVTQVVMEAEEQGSGDMPSPLDVAEKQYRYNAREKKFLRGMVEEVIPGHKSKQELGMEIYPNAKTPATASAIVSENLKKPKFKDALALAFEAADVTPTSLAEVIKDAMGATKTAQVAGEIITSDVPDHGIRVSAARAAAAILVEKDDKDGGSTFNFNFNSGTQSFINKPEISQK